MNHYTLITGHNRVSPRSEVSDDAIRVCRPLIVPGTHEIPGPLGKYTLVVPETAHGLLGTVYQAKAPVASIGVADTPEASAEIWPALLGLHERLGLPGDPVEPELPWIATTILLSAPAMEWLGDFERCWAWAWLERQP